jgi:pilus assembly protein CpaC
VPRAPAPARAAGARPGEETQGAAGQDPIKMVTIPLGQSRRWVLDHQATAVIAATPEIADVRLLSPELLYVIGRGVGRTSVAVLDDHGLLDEWLVTTVLDLEPVHAVLASDPALRGVRVQHFSRGVTLTGAVASAAVAERAYRLVAAALPENAILENEIEVEAPQQVNLEVQIAEVQRSVTETLGISWEAFNAVGSSSDLLWRIGRPQMAAFALGPVAALEGLTTGFVEGQPTSSVAARYRGARGAVQGVVDALASAGLANVLARPNLTAISGETASFFSGGEFPLPVGFRDGVIVFEYKKYGVLLDFVPTVVDPDRITLTVRPEVSDTSDIDSLVTVGTEIPVINVRRAETTVELGNGESIVIAGLFRSGSNTVESGLPGLKDLPIFGLLFRSNRVEASETELIVVVTANLVSTGADRTTTAAGPVPATRQIHGYHF